MKVSRTVWSRGKDGDDLKILPLLSFATTMLSTETLTLKELQDRLGHEKEETTKIYAHALKSKTQNNPIFD